jgi:porphobilinogen synthase
VEEGIDDFQEIRSMPGVMRIPEARLAGQIERYARAGVRSIMTFGVSHNKDAIGSDTWLEHGLTARIARTCKAAVPEMVVISDTCFCEYTKRGHCGVLRGGGVDNDATLASLGKQAVTAARAGADIIAPSAAVDGQVAAIRAALDSAGMSRTAIMSYSTKIGSSLCGPFREASGAMLRGDRKVYQMNPVNRREAVRESLLDEAEGADVIMVKPGGLYLDILREIRNASQLPLAAYQVSGEYAMIKFASAAGADLILSYFTMGLAIQGV